MACGETSLSAIITWDLIPKIAIEEMVLTPGCQPALRAQYARWRNRDPNQRRAKPPGRPAFLERRHVWPAGGEANAVVGTRTRSTSWRSYRSAWRQFSPSSVRQSFGKLGWQSGKTIIGLSFAYGDNNLTGNGVQDFRNLEKNLFERLHHSGRRATMRRHSR